MMYPTTRAFYNDYKGSKVFHKYTHKRATGTVNNKIKIDVLHHKSPFILLNWCIWYPFQEVNRCKHYDNE